MTLLKVRLRKLGTGSAVLVFAAACAASHAQQQLPIGTVSTLDATVTGASSTSDDRAQLSTNGTVVAKDHVAYVQLFRGGSVKVCATSGVHLTAGTAAPAPSTPASVDPAAQVPAPSATPAPAPPPIAIPPLMVALDRGAMELRMSAISGDIVMTPDLRFTFSGDGQLDVHIRVTRNGDTCVENRIAGLSGHPELRVGSLFGNETYNVLPGQHVLFEGGNLREVVDNESSPCGCPEAPVKPPAPEVGEISLKKVPQATAPAVAAVQHPFPADVSQGLAPPPPVRQAPPGVVHTQIATSLVYNPAAAEAQENKDAAAKPPAPAEKSGFFHRVGRFFKHIF
jgi:hypothetical protein